MSSRNAYSLMGEPADAVAGVALDDGDSMRAAQGGDWGGDRVGDRWARDMGATGLITIAVLGTFQARAKVRSSSMTRSSWAVRAEHLLAAQVCGTTSTTIGGREGWMRWRETAHGNRDDAARSLSAGSADEIR